jgi:hypothetical protein
MTNLKKLLVVAVAAMICAPALAADDDSLTAAKLLPMCNSNKLEEKLVCSIYAQATVQSLLVISLTDVDDTKDIGKRGVGKICVPQSQVIVPNEVIRDAVKMLADMPLVGQFPAAMVMLATIRNRFPCKK